MSLYGYTTISVSQHVSALLELTRQLSSGDPLDAATCANLRNLLQEASDALAAHESAASRIQSIRQENMKEDQMLAHNKPTDAHKAAMRHAIANPLSIDENKTLRLLIGRHLDYLRGRSCTGTGSPAYRGIVEYGWRAIPIISAYISVDWRMLQPIATIVGTSACRPAVDGNGESVRGDVSGILTFWHRWLDEVGAS
jgi:hypothetical protein